MTREEWLNSAIDALRPAFQAQGKPLPEQIHVSIGFTSKRKAIGQCWSPEASADKRHHIYIAPTHRTDVEVLDTLTHELCHAALPTGAGHRKPFQVLAGAMGLVKPWTATHASPELVTRLQAIIAQIGPSPHATLRADFQTKKQTTRLRLFACECGVKVRVARDSFNATCTDCDSPFERQD